MSQSPSKQASTNRLSESDYHRILADAHRRVALDILSTRATPVELRELATAIAAREIDATSPSTDVVDEVSVVLHHRHLPLLSDRGAIDYDPATRRIESVHVTADILP